MLDQIQAVIEGIGFVIGFIPYLGPLAKTVPDLLNVAISLARGNYEDARTYAIEAVPIIGTIYGVGEMGQALSTSLTGHQAAANGAKSGAGDDEVTPEIEYLLPNLDRGTGNSFADGTGVVTGVDASGNFTTTAIENIQVGDVVLATDEFNPEAPPEYKLVTAVSSRTVDGLKAVSYEVNGNTETIQVTDNHEFFVVGVGWVDAALLVNYVRQNLLLADGREVAIGGVTDVAGLVTVHNLTVSDGATYFVDDGTGDVDAVVVHNAGRKVLKSIFSKLKNGEYYIPESMSKIARRYQRQVTRMRNNMVYIHNGYKFDAFRGRKLIDAKGPGYLNRIQSQRGAEIIGLKLLDQAQRQLKAAGDVPVRWIVAEKDFERALKRMFDKNNINIEVVFKPLKTKF